MKHTKIEISPETRCKNNAIEFFDLATHHRFDRVSAADAVIVCEQAAASAKRNSERTEWYRIALAIQDAFRPRLADVKPLAPMPEG